MGLLNWTMRTWVPGPLGADALNAEVRDTLTALQSAWDASTYTPVLTSTGTAFALGNGTAVGYWNQQGKTIDFAARITFGSTTTFGTGTYRISLPLPMRYGIASQLLGKVFDNSASDTYLCGTYGASAGGTTVGFALTGTNPTVPAGATAPVTAAVNDFFEVGGRYEAQ
jgi:hypothetical protein